MRSIKKCFVPLDLSVSASFSLLIFRLIMGVAFLFHGWGKIQTPFAWMPEAAGVPAFLQFLAAISEFGGGLALILGLLIPLSMLGLGFTMLVATFMHAVMRGDPFVGQGGPSYELALVYLGACLVFLTVGPGRFSLDRLFFKR